MYTKVTQSGGRRYLQLVEGYRNEAGKVHHRVIANLGRVDELTPEKLDPLINGLNRVLGRAENTASELAHEPACMSISIETGPRIGVQKGPPCLVC